MVQWREAHRELQLEPGMSWHAIALGSAFPLPVLNWRLPSRECRTRSFEQMVALWPGSLA